MLIGGAHGADVAWRPLPTQLQLTDDAAGGG
jgi:hypothetical protein